MSENNSVHLIGRLAENAKLAKTKEGRDLCAFTVAIPKEAGGTSLIDLALFGVAARTLQPLLLRGKTVSVEGALDQSVREHDGKTYSNLHVSIADIQFVEENASPAEGGGPEPGDDGFIDFEDEDFGDEALAEAEAIGL